MKHILFFILLSSSLLAFSSEVEWSSRIQGNTIQQGESIDVEDGDYLDLNTNSFVDINDMGFIRFGVGESSNMDFTEDITLAVEFTLTEYDNQWNISNTSTHSLDIDYITSNSTQSSVNLDELRLTGVHKFSIQIDYVTANKVSDGSSVAIPNQVYLEAGFSSTRYYLLDNNAIPSIGVNTVSFDHNTGQETIIYHQVQTTTQTDEFEIFWDYIDGAEEYDLEWTWVDNYSNSNLSSTIHPSGIDFSEVDFKRNSTRIRTGKQSYRIPHIFGRGYLIYRVRAVGRWLDAPNKLKYGTWSSNTGTNKNTVEDWPHLLEVTSEHENELNWQYQATYAEEGKKKEVTQYFDGSLRERQTVTRINSDYQAVVGEKIYDNQGRDAISILPSPVKNPAIRYYDNFNLNQSGKPYSHLDFDWEDTLAKFCSSDFSGVLSDSSGASRYYSDNHTEENWQQYVPDAEGYAFVQKQYTPDNTGRIRSQSGVGTHHKIGSGRETKYYYLQPSQAELNRLFGYKVGYKSRYKKNMVVDANGQVSISYLDPQGRVIATSLAGDNATEFDDLESLNAPGQHSTLSTDLLGKLNQNDFDTPQDDNNLFATSTFNNLNDGLKMNTQLGVIQDNSEYDFTYEVETDYYEDSCNPNIGYPYVYDLNIVLQDDCGDTLVGIIDTIGNSIIGQTNGFTEMFSESNISLDQGSYSLSKSITVNEEAFNIYLEDYLENNECILELEDFIDPVDTSCYTTCEECAEALGTETEFMDSVRAEMGGSLTPEQDTFYLNLHATQLAFCWEPCETKSSCQALYEMLLTDVSLNGQYGSMSSGDPLSVYNENNNLPDANTDWKHPSSPYLDQFGNPALVDDGTGNMVAPENLSRQMFIDNYQPSWAESLVPYHPEYELYLFRKDFCEETISVGGESLSSDEFDQVLQSDIDSYDKALGNSNWNIDFLTGSSSELYNLDPYFNINYSSHNISGSTSSSTYTANFNAVGSQMMNEAISTNYDGSGMSMFDFAVSIVKCGSNFSGTCTTSITSWSDVDTQMTPQEQDEMWQQYKSLYLGQKMKIQQLIQDFYGFQDVNNIYNGCIGGVAYDYPFILNFDWYSGYQTLILGYSILEEFTFPFNGLSLTLCGGEYDSKTIRIPRADGLIGGSGSNASNLANASAAADYEIWSQTGLCPEILDMEMFIKELAVSGALTSTINSNSIPQFTADLYTTMTGTPLNGNTPPIMGNIEITGSVNNASSLDIVVHEGQTVYCTITLDAPGQYSWSDYESTWFIYDLSGSFPSSTNPNGVDILITAGTTPQDAQQYVVSYSSCIPLNDCQSEYSNSGGVVNENDPDCNKKEIVTSELVAIMNDKIVNNEFFSSSVSLQGDPLYVGSELGVLIEDNNYQASWEYSPSMIGFRGAGGFTHLRLDIFPNTIPSDILQVVSLDIDGADFTMQILRGSPGSPSQMTITGTNLVQYVSDPDLPLPLDFGCPCEEFEYEEGEELADFINHLLSLNSVPQGYVPPNNEFATKELWQNIINIPNTTPGVYNYGVANGLQSIFNCYLTSTGNQPTYSCPLSFRFVDQTLTYTSADIDYVMNIYFPYNTIVSFHGTAVMHDGTSVGIVGRASCLYIEQNTKCDECEPEAMAPVSCNSKYDDYVHIMDSLATAVEDTVTLSESEFCDKQFAAITDAYIYYLQALNVPNKNSLLFISIAQFGATPIGYDNQQLRNVIDDYAVYVNNIPVNNFPVIWNDFLTYEYMQNNGLCPGVTPPIELPDTSIIIPCNQWGTNISNVNAQNQYEIYIEQLTESFRDAYVEGAIESLVERFTESHEDKEYHYTLYYYDRAGNLVQTVPPMGVKRFDGSDVALNNHINEKRESLPNADDSNLAPLHDHETIYKYNSLNQLVYQRTPDGGESRFAYDRLGRLVVSQNDKQKAEGRFSYTRYDELGRVYEVGQLRASSSEYQINEIGRLVTSSGYEYNVNHPSFPNNWSMDREQVTHTFYDDFKFDLNGSPTPLIITGGLAENQFEDYHFDNTRNRIMAVLYQDFYEPDLNKYNNTTIYNYDVHGNVEELIQVNNDPKLVAFDQSVKKLIYTYDLLSGNVNEVIYQKGKTDEFRHEYNYDADNRITSVSTSKDGVIKEQDAKYFYYEHGPLARTEVGHSKVQAMDYAYTIQGWIKAVNGEEVDEQTMMGWDGAQKTNSQVSSTVNKHVAKDVFGYSLSYYEDDYKSSNTDFLNHSKGVNSNFNAGLYNGNIRSMFTALSNEKEEAIRTHQTNYTYDQLNRITSMTGYNRIVGESPSSSGFSSRYNFDENGNLLELHRAAAFKEMDRFEYFYNDPFNNGKNNRLSGLRDHAGESDFEYVDIDNSITPNNYKYDEIGQLIQDEDEGIEEIKWTVTNKVKEMQYANGKIISFDYDAMGNRIAKHFKYEDKEISTYYILDAQGNQMAMYTHKKDDPIGSGAKSLYLSERNIYGSSRIGQEKIDKIIASSKANLININTATQNSIGDKFFEMSNHLGNVLEVVTDRKLPVPNDNGKIEYFLADVVSYSDYYPGGMVMPERSGNESSYRYGYNSMEKDDEVKGAGNSYDFGARMYDPRIFRWMSRDKLSQKKPYLSPYQAMRNNPLIYNDPDGNDEYLKIVINIEGRNKPIVIESKEPIRENIYLAGMIMYGGDTRVFPEQILHDYTTVLTVDIGKNGEITGSPTKSTEKHKDRGNIHKKLYLGWFGSGWNEGEIADLDSEFTLPGGFYMSSESGEGSLFTSENATYVGNIDDLLTAFSAMKKLGTLNKVRKGQKSGIDALDELVLEEIVKAMAPEVKKQMKKKSQDSDTDYSKKEKSSWTVTNSENINIVTDSDGSIVKIDSVKSDGTKIRLYTEPGRAD